MDINIELAWLREYANTASRAALSAAGQQELARIIDRIDQHMLSQGVLPTEWAERRA